ncbi:MAG: hypothetical protein JJU13_11450 [Balneolaceae bacterium]|nr:hypothetical protein [Balneolaceae bacterium]
MPDILIMILPALLYVEETDTSTQTLESEYLPDPVSVNVITPKDYIHEQSYPLLYLLHGFNSNFNQWSQITDLQKVADEYDVIIANPDGFRSFYMNSPVNESSRYESFFFENLVPFLHLQYSINSDQIFISELSMGGFGALHLMLSRPDYFAVAGSTSGAVEFEYPFWNVISHQFLGNSRLADVLESILGSHKKQSGNWKDHSLINPINEFSKHSVPIFLDVGTGDPLYEMNRKLFEHFREKETPVHFLAKPGGHDHDYWNRSVYFHLNFYRKIMDNSNSDGGVNR